MARFIAVCSITLLALTCASAFSLRGDVLSLNHEAAVADDDAPWFCHGLDCPKFKVLNKTDVYELREYEEGDWASTKISGGFTVSMTKGFARLFEYISGANVEKQKVTMTAPVGDFILTEPGFSKTKDNYTVSFYVPKIFQGKAPEPTADDVEIVHYPSVKVYVTQFGGYATEASLLKKAAELAAALQADGIQVDDGFFVWAGYDPPYRVTGRHNEVWLFKKESSV